MRPEEEYAGPERTVRDLGDDMSEVLVRWARSSGRRDESGAPHRATAVCGHLSPEVTRLLPASADRNEDPVLIRLHVDPNGPLADLPWEFATDPRDSKRFLAATEGYAFVRVHAGAPVRPPRIKSRSPEEHVRGFTVIVQSDSTKWPAVFGIQKVSAWPQKETLGEMLDRSITGPKCPDDSPVFIVDKLTNPTLYDLQTQGFIYDIVHYVGFGYQEPEDISPPRARSFTDRLFEFLRG